MLDPAESTSLSWQQFLAWRFLLSGLFGWYQLNRPAGREDGGRCGPSPDYRPLMPPLGGPLGAGPPLLGPRPGPGPQPPRPERPDGP